MDIPDAIKGENASRLLLSPVFLLEEVAGSLIPGILFFALLFLKKTPINATLDAAGLGYKTKICIALLFAYVMGKALHGIVFALIDYCDKSEGGELWDKMPDGVKGVVVGIIASPLFAGEGRVIEHYMVFKAGVSLQVCSGAGAWLLVAALIPGDRFLRPVEFLAGLALLILGIKEARTSHKILAAVMGMAIGNFAKQYSLEEVLAAVTKGWPVIKQILTSMASSGTASVPEVPVPSGELEARAKEGQS